MKWYTVGLVLLAVILSLFLGCSACDDDEDTAEDYDDSSDDSTPAGEGDGSTGDLKADSWHYQLDGSVSGDNPAKLYDIDLFDNSESKISSLQSDGKTVICYFSAGTYEPGRPDSSRLSGAAGASVEGWPGEKWLDITDSSVREVMTERLDLAQEKGCDGVEPDNVDGYENAGENSKGESAEYVRWLASEAHSRGLKIGLKNAIGLLGSVKGSVDFAVNEECDSYDECGSYSSFGKTVYHIEYGGCPGSTPDNFVSITGSESLSGSTSSCD